LVSLSDVSFVLSFDSRGRRPSSNLIASDDSPKERNRVAGAIYRRNKKARVQSQLDEVKFLKEENDQLLKEIAEKEQLIRAYKAYLTSENIPCEYNPETD